MFMLEPGRWDRTKTVLSEFLVAAVPGVVEWLEANIKLPRKFSPRGFGKFSTASRPFQRPILETFHPQSGVTDCVVSGATQLAKTAMLLLGGAFRMVWEPLPIILAVPSIDFAKKKIVQRRLHPLINENPVLAALKPANPDEFTLTEMNMQGGEFTLAGTGSNTNLSSITAGIVLQDEVCKFVHAKSGDDEEAHPMHLADERAKDFHDLAFRYKSSSPTSETHPFWSAFEAGSQTAFFVPCPNCHQHFQFEFVRDAGKDYRSVVWDKEAKDRFGLWDQDKVIASARYICPHCGFPIRSEQKADMIARYEMKDMNEGAGRSNRSFYCPSFLSPNISFGAIAWEFLRGNDFFGLQNFYNSWLALPFSSIAAKVDEEAILKLRNMDYRRGTIPRMPQSLIVTADPGQTSGTHWMVTALMEDGEIYVIDWGMVLDVFDLDGHPRKAGYPLAGTKKLLAPACGWCDSRYNSEKAYALCFRSHGFWKPTRGSDALFGHWTAQPVQSHPGLRVFVFVDHSLKTELYGRRIAGGEPPRIHIPADADKMLIDQLKGQKLDATTGKWKKLVGDHLGDCLKQAVLHQWIGRAVVDTVAKYRQV